MSSSDRDPGDMFDVAAAVRSDMEACKARKRIKDNRRNDARLEQFEKTFGPFREVLFGVIRAHRALGGKTKYQMFLSPPAFYDHEAVFYLERKHSWFSRVLKSPVTGMLSSVFLNSRAPFEKKMEEGYLYWDSKRGLPGDVLLTFRVIENFDNTGRGGVQIIPDGNILEVPGIKSGRGHKLNFEGKPIIFTDEIDVWRRFLTNWLATNLPESDLNLLAQSPKQAVPGASSPHAEVIDIFSRSSGASSSSPNQGEPK